MFNERRTECKRNNKSIINDSFLSHYLFNNMIISYIAAFNLHRYPLITHNHALNMVVVFNTKWFKYIISHSVCYTKSNMFYKTFCNFVEDFFYFIFYDLFPPKTTWKNSFFIRVIFANGAIVSSTQCYKPQKRRKKISSKSFPVS